MWNFFDYFPPILVINLPERTDRLQLIKKELINYNYIVIEAVKTNLGCNLSHQKCIKYAIDNHFPEVCIMEDDFMFIRNDKIILPKNFDMFFIGGDIHDYHFKKIDNSYRLKSIKRAEGYIIKKHYYKTFLNMLEETWEKLLKEPDNINFRLDMYWNKLTEKDNWRVNVNGLYGGQREGFSNIKNKYIKRTNTILI